MKIPFLSFLFLFIYHISVSGQNKSFFIDYTTRSSDYQLRNLYYVAPVSDGYIAVHADVDPNNWQVLPIPPGEVHIKKMDVNGKVIKNKNINHRFGFNTPDCYAVGDKTVIGYFDSKKTEDSIFVYFNSLLFDKELNTLDSTTHQIFEVSIDKYQNTGYYMYGSWKETPAGISQFLSMDEINAVYSIHIMYNVDGTFREIKSIDKRKKNPPSIEQYFSETPITYGTQGHISAFLAKHYIFDQDWNIIDTLDNINLRENKPDLKRHSLLGESDRIIHVDMFLPPQDDYIYNTIAMLDTNFKEVKKIELPKVRYDHSFFNWYSLTPRGGLYKNEDGYYSLLTNYFYTHYAFYVPGKAIDTIPTYLVRMNFDEDFNLICHKHFRYPKHKLKLNNMTHVAEGQILITGYIDVINYPSNFYHDNHPFFAFIPNKGCDIPHLEKTFDMESIATDMPVFEGQVLCYPTISKDFITFEYSGYKKYSHLKIDVYNELGQISYNTHWDGTQLVYDTKNLTPGTYFYIITATDGSATSGKFIKQ